jgi:pheromone shutdown protein TraB
MQAEIYDVDYSDLVHILGTTRFSKRSLYDAYRLVDELKPTDLAIELDMTRYKMLNHQCATCPRSQSCTRKCEFIGAVEALDNRDTNIWLIDMSKREFTERAYRSGSLYPYWPVLLNERDTLMAARLAWIASEELKKGADPQVLALVGAAHVRGMESMLKNPIRIRDNLRSFGLSFTQPQLIRRIRISGD